MVSANRRRIFKHVQAWLGIGAIVGLAVFFYVHRSDLDAVVEVRLPYLLFVAAGCAILTAARAWMFRITYFYVAADVKLVRWWAIGVVASILNQLLVSSAGVAYRAAWLKVRARVRVIDTLMLQAAYVGCLLGVAAATGATAMLAVVGAAVTGSELFWVFIAVMAVVLAALMVFLLVPLGRYAGERGIVAALERLQVVLRNRKVLLGLVLTNLVVVVVGGVLFWGALAGMGHGIGLVDSVLYGTALGLSNLVVVTPGNLGLMEAVSGGMAVALGGAVELGVAAAVVIRVVNVVTLAVLGVVAWPTLQKRGPESVEGEPAVDQAPAPRTGSQEAREG